MSCFRGSMPPTACPNTLPKDTVLRGLDGNYYKVVGRVFGGKRWKLNWIST